MKKAIQVLAALVCASIAASAKDPVTVHSHNDYKRDVPFHQAYAQKITSIECDMYYVGSDDFYVGHELEETTPDVNFDNKYLEPVLELYRNNGGHAWADDPERPLQLLVEIKSDDPDEFLKALVRKLSRYPEVFDPAVNPKACRIVMTGNLPEPADWDRYPSFITFDGLLEKKYTPQQLERVAIISECFDNYSHWKGEGPMSRKDFKTIREAVSKAHSMGKPIRFWGCPDNVTTWSAWISLGIDYLNTDQPELCRRFLSGRMAGSTASKKKQTGR